jgi:lipopolysaccharide/colanic/teichoic acid biosynthesis glycosyltransferase
MLSQVAARPELRSHDDPVGLGQATQLLTRKAGERARERRRVIAGLLAIDVVAVLLAVAAAGTLRATVDAVLPLATFGWPERHVVASIFVVPVLIALFWFQGRYDIQNCLIGPREYAQIAHAITYGVIIALGLSYFAGGEPLVSRSWLFFVWLFSFAFVSAGRFTSRHVVRRLRRHGLLRTNVIIVGASSAGIALAQQFRAAEGEGIDVVGFLDEYLPVGQELLPGLAVVGRPSELVHRRRDVEVDEYVLVPQAVPWERLEEITRLMIARRGPILRMAVNSSSLLTHGVLVTNRSSVPLLTMQRARIAGLDLILKTGLDIFGAAIALMLLGPPTLVVMGRAIALGRGPIFENHPIAVDGRSANLQLLSRRVCGALPLRGTPALVGVLRGQLSLIGPRPTAFQPDDDAQPLWLTAIKPGLTGSWRLSGRHASREEQALQDLGYVRNYSIWEDFRILWVSVIRLLGSRADLVRWEDPAA